MFFPLISLVWEGFGAQIAWGTSSETFQNQGNERKIHVLKVFYKKNDIHDLKISDINYFIIILSLAHFKKNLRVYGWFRQYRCQCPVGKPLTPLSDLQGDGISHS